MKIIIDVMGGDNAPGELVDGAYQASLEIPADYVLVGDKAQIEEAAEKRGIDISAFEIVHTPVFITMEDDPMCVTRSKNDSSMSVGMRLLAEGGGDAFVSTGNTGALYTGANLIVRKVRGIQRPAIATVLPMNPPVLLLDSGANINVLPEYLEQFAVMGAVYMKKIYGTENPRVGLLNNGSEECKGTELQLAAYSQLKDCSLINFVGNVEANKLPYDVCDVIVTDGFTGNILLKSIEGMGKLMLDTMKNIFYTNAGTKMAALLVKKQLSAVKKSFDSSEHGGAPILGISKPVIKAHGSSRAKAFKSAIRQAVSYAQTGISDDIAVSARILAEKRKAEKVK